MQRTHYIPDARKKPESIFSKELQEEINRSGGSKRIGALRGKHVYGGTVLAPEAARRHKKAKAGRRAARLNRRK